MTDDKDIFVTEETWNELCELNKTEQTFDALLKELIQARSKHQLAKQAREVREADREELTSLDELRNFAE